LPADTSAETKLLTLLEKQAGRYASPKIENWLEAKYFDGRSVREIAQGLDTTEKGHRIAPGSRSGESSKRVLLEGLRNE